jgi:hypothetical protein
MGQMQDNIGRDARLKQPVQGNNGTTMPSGSIVNIYATTPPLEGPFYKIQIIDKKFPKGRWTGVVKNLDVVVLDGK